MENDVEKIISTASAITMGVLFIVVGGICVRACIETKKENNKQDENQNVTIEPEQDTKNEENVIKTEDGSLYAFEADSLEL